MESTTRSTRWREYWRREVRPFLIMALVLFAVRSSLADWNDVPTGSMKPTILEGDRVFVNKLAYDLKVPFTTWHIATWGSPKRGDVVVFYSPHDGQRLVKRVVGLPGDTLELRDNILWVNGKAVKYSSLGSELLRDVDPVEQIQSFYAQEHLGEISHAVAAIPGVQARRDFGPIRVAPGQYFMMGDNRDNSFDSRFYGAVPRQQILGRATTVALSFDRQHHWAPRWARFFKSLGA